MARLFYHTMQDNLGNLLFDVSGTMRIAGTGTLATIYGDEALTVILANPMTNHPSFGSFKCFLGAGDYDFYMAKAGYTFETLTGVQGHGTMAQQDAGAVAITGGIVTGLSRLEASQIGISAAVVPGYVITTGPGLTYLAGNIGVNRLAQANLVAGLNVAKLTQYGLWLQATDGDAAGNPLVAFVNQAATVIGSITTNATGTAYNTTSDGRLKHDVETLTGELDVVRALRPVRFRWNADDTPGVGFLAGEVAAHVQGVIHGEPDAVDEAGGIIPQMIDMSKLVPFLVGAIQSLAARVAVLEDALGV